MTGSIRTILVAAAGGLALLIGQPAARAQFMNNGATVILAFGTMYGVDEAFVGDANPIRDVVGDELPWQVESARGRLDVGGHLKIRVRGLVFTDDDIVPPELRLRNDETDFRALVSCLSEKDGAVTTENVVTEGFPSSPFGDSDIDAQITLPNPCVAPIVFVMSGSEDKWFAVTGFETENGGHNNNQDMHPSRAPTFPLRQPTFPLPSFPQPTFPQPSFPEPPSMTVPLR